jgi:hypothetical protein
MFEFQEVLATISDIAPQEQENSVLCQIGATSLVMPFVLLDDLVTLEPLVLMEDPRSPK